MLTNYISRYSAFGLKMEVQKRDKTGFSIIGQQLSLIHIFCSILAASSSFQMVVAQTFLLAAVSFVPGTRSAKLSLSKSRTFRTLWVLIEYFTNTIRQTFKPCKNSDMENTLTNPDSGEISNPCRRGWPATSFG